MEPLDADAIRKALTTARDGGFRSVKLNAGGTSFQAVISEDALAWGESWEDEGETPDSDGPKTQAVPAPVVGYVRFAADIATGSAVKAGQAVGEVLALGIANEIVCPCAGDIKTVLVEEGAAVEYGQTLIEVELK